MEVLMKVKEKFLGGQYHGSVDEMAWSHLEPLKMMRVLLLVGGGTLYPGDPCMLEEEHMFAGDVSMSCTFDEQLFCLCMSCTFDEQLSYPFDGQLGGWHEEGWRTSKVKQEDLGPSVACKTSCVWSEVLFLS